MTESDNTDSSDIDTSVSKSERKRQMHALQDLGERLVALPEADLATIPINDERLRDAVQTARRITARGGLKRQLQFIGKLMRSIDPSPLPMGSRLLSIEPRRAPLNSTVLSAREINYAPKGTARSETFSRSGLTPRFRN